MLNPSRTRSEGEAVRAQRGGGLRPPLWLLLAGIIVIGIGVGLFATSITAILLSSSTALAADPTAGSVLPHPRTPLASVDGLHL